jgi:hypothetical protein
MVVHLLHIIMNRLISIIVDSRTPTKVTIVIIFFRGLGWRPLRGGTSWSRRSSEVQHLGSWCWRRSRFHHTRAWLFLIHYKATHNDLFNNWKMSQKYSIKIQSILSYTHKNLRLVDSNIQSLLECVIYKNLCTPCFQKMSKFHGNTIATN